MNVYIWGDSELARRVRGMFDGHSDTVVGYPQHAEFHISCQYDRIFSREEIDRYGYIMNIHFSDTSVMRGCNPMSHVIENGMKETAVTFHVIDEGIDTGPVLLKKGVPVRPDDTAKTLYDRCTETAFETFCELWDTYLRNKPEGVEQTELGTYYPRELNRELHLFEWQRRFIRSRTFPGKPRPYIVLDGEEIEL